jgi:hypothetical protein
MMTTIRYSKPITKLLKKSTLKKMMIAEWSLSQNKIKCSSNLLRLQGQHAELLLGNLKIASLGLRKRKEHQSNYKKKRKEIVV